MHRERETEVGGKELDRSGTASSFSAFVGDSQVLGDCNRNLLGIACFIRSGRISSLEGRVNFMKTSF